MESRALQTPATTRRKRLPKPAAIPAASVTSSPPREIPASVPEYKCFAHIRDPKMREAKCYEQQLLILRDMFPRYGERIEEEIAFARQQAERSSPSDRDRVIKKLQTVPLSCREVADDLEIPYITAYKILQEYAGTGVVIITQRPGIAGNKPVCYYSLSHAETL